MQYERCHGRATQDQVGSSVTQIFCIDVKKKILQDAYKFPTGLSKNDGRKMRRKDDITIHRQGRMVKKRPTAKWLDSDWKAKRK